MPPLPAGIPPCLSRNKTSDKEDITASITVFGATGAIGRLVVEKLLAEGLDVIAYVRTPSKLTAEHPRLTLMVGELSNAGKVADAVKDSDAGISALGPSLRRGSKGTPITDGTRNIVTAMQAAGVRQLIALATPSIADPRDRPTLKARVLPKLARAFFPNALTDLVGATEAVTTSNLDWTLAHITNPTDRPARGTLRAGFLGRDNVGSAMSRHDIAAFLVTQVADTTYLHAAPAISN
jgi:putative NADH-flavin reductase